MNNQKILALRESLEDYRNNCECMFSDNSAPVTQEQFKDFSRQLFYVFDEFLNVLEKD